MAAPRASGRRSAELARRVATAVVGIPVLLLLNAVGGPVFVGAAALIMGLAALEVCRAAGMPWADPLPLTAAAGAGATVATAAHSGEAQIAALSGTLAMTLAVVVFRAETERGFGRWSGALAAAAYVGVLGGHLVLLRGLADGADWLLLALLLTFAADTGAYFTGRTIGGRKLAPHVSPGKTASGAAGGVLAGALAAVGLRAALDLSGAPVAFLLMGAVAAACSIIGDLAESLIKRSLGVKDMGHLLPGHGGLMDRLDSILFSAPVVYYLAQWISA